MNYSSIISSSFSWVSGAKAAWFIIFFCLALPVYILLPSALNNQVFTGFSKNVAVLLYDILYLAIILGVIVLIQHSLASKKQHVCVLHSKRLLGLLGVVFTEFFHILVYSISPVLRPFQLLFLLASVLSYYCYTVFSADWLHLVFSACLLGYFMFAVYNAVRVFFSTSIYCSNEKLGFVDAVRESYFMTHGKVSNALFGILFSVLIAFVIFAFITVALGSIAVLVLGIFFIHSIAVYFGFNIAMAFGLGVALISYHHAIADLFVQLHSHFSTSSKIKRILLRRELYSSHKGLARRSFKKKPSHKKKKRR